MARKKESIEVDFLFLGEIGKRKGVYDLLQVIADNKPLFAGKMRLCIGGNLEEKIIKAFIKDNCISDIVTFKGWIKGEEKMQCLNWGDVYVLPSYNEGLPIAILEAMSYSHPVISTNVGGIPEILHSHKNGIMISPGNLDQLKNALLFFIEHPQKILEYGENAYETVQPFFPQNVFNHLKAIYSGLLNEHSQQ